MKKLVGIMGVLSVTILLTGCVYADNKDWSNMTEDEKETVREAYHQVKEELAEDFAEHTVEGRFANWVIDLVGNEIAP